MPNDTSTRSGIVYIVGGGPGDPGLITVKGLQCLRSADVVLYDRLAPLELLAEVSPHAELIDVGKEPKRHRRSQDEINTLLIEKAREGRTLLAPLLDALALAKANAAARATRRTKRDAAPTLESASTTDV